MRRDSSHKAKCARRSKLTSCTLKPRGLVNAKIGWLMEAKQCGHLICRTRRTQTHKARFTVRFTLFQDLLVLCINIWRCMWETTRKAMSILFHFFTSTVNL
ncbi:hypothetical protein DVH24_036655 [Malus domestica]|uniref:Uncharacterized protein n=1 Tax=Malus domestica TaxID=3750 RepID=A0A498IJK7_MALDO|nr:hypothetical protein DVH24_036655 [Malus domestica]